MRRGQQLKNEEVTFSDHQQLVSTTDVRGVITYANKEFCNIAGFNLEELIGKNHNIVRHPDMPKAAFKEMWEKLKQGHSWRGMVKNRCKDGRYYWVDAFVTPIFEHGQLVGYQSVRTKPSEQLKRRAQSLYTKIIAGKSLSSWREWVGVRQSAALLIGLIGLVLLAAFVSISVALITALFSLLIMLLKFSHQQH